MGVNSVCGESGGFVPVEAAAEDRPLWTGAPTQGLGEQDPNPIHHYPKGEDH